jgi:hypothetical protein
LQPLFILLRPLNELPLSFEGQAPFFDVAVGSHAHPLIDCLVIFGFGVYPSIINTRSLVGGFSLQISAFYLAIQISLASASFPVVVPAGCTGRLALAGDRPSLI